MTQILPPGMEPNPPGFPPGVVAPGTILPAPNGQLEPPTPEVVWSIGSITALPDGRLELRMVDGSVVVVRRRTKLEFRELKFAYAEAEADYNRVVALGMFRLRQMGARDRTDETEADMVAALDVGDEIAASLKVAGDVLADRLTAWWQDIDAGRSDKYGPGCTPRLGDPDDWPSDLIDSKDIFQKIIDFWTHNP